MGKNVYRDVGLSGIAILPNRMRKLRPEVVNDLAADMKVAGLLHPIILRPQPGIGYYLVAGAHRLEAAKQLKWESISAHIVEGFDADKALKAEINENLLRAELTPAETAAHVDMLKEIYEKEHPETKRGGSLPVDAKAQQSESQIATTTITKPKAFIEEAAGSSGKHRSTIARSAQHGQRIPNVAELAGTSLDKVEELNALAKLGKTAPERRDEIIRRVKAGETVSAKAEVKKEHRAEQNRKFAETTKLAMANLGIKTYGVIYADPPWRFEPYSRETGMDRSADNHYDTMDIEDIKNMAVPAANDCVLFLWATVPMLPEALDVMKAWGFKYKSLCIWNKDRIGTGYWFRNKAELLLVGTRGHIPAPAMGEQYASVIDAAVTKHSRKPPCFAEMIEEMFPGVPAIEMFARGERLGWDVWGNQAHAIPTPEPETVSVDD